MALITYLTRVHFADGVLEEALRSELELYGCKRPVIIADADDLNSGFADRLFSSFPIRTKSTRCELSHDTPMLSAVATVNAHYVDHGADALIAFEKARLIQLAQLARVIIANTDVMDGKSKRRRGQGQKQKLPPLFAIPGVDGLAVSASVAASDFQLLANSRYSMTELLPTAIICDPTLTLGATARSSASAGVNAMARCIEAYLSNAYNPPADGIALDGLERSASNLHRVLRDDRLEVRREMMAASLDGALAQQKGIGISQALSAALSDTVGTELDPGALARLLLPEILRLNAKALKEKYQPIRRILGINPRQSLADGVRCLFERLPLPARLSEMGVTAIHIDQASSLAIDGIDHAIPVRMPKKADLASIMQAVL